MNGETPARTGGIGRRNYLRASVAAVGGSALLSGCLGEFGGILAAGTSSSTDWPTFAGDVGNTGATTGAGPGTATERWNAETGPVLTTPAVADGVVYVGNRRSGDDSDEGGRLLSIDAETGETQWSFDVAKWVSGTPAVTDGVVYAAGPTADGSEDDVESEDIDHRVYAIDTDGTELWTADVGGQGSVSPTVVDGTVYVVTWDGTYALDAETGDQQWIHYHEGHAWGAPALVDGTVYVGTSSEAYALEAATGDVQWRYSPDDEPSRTWVAPAVADGTVYLVSGRGEDGLVALEAETGDVQWRTDASVPTQTPVVADGTLYAGLLSGTSQGTRILAVDTETGEERWTFETDDRGGAVSVGGDTAYVRTLEGVYALDVDGGEPRWDGEFEFDSDRPWQGEVTEEVTSIPAIADGALFVGSPSGGLYAIGEE
ncbi:PQQ-binding-like beta-propeller repeat protein [Halomontanus rarus]|uniref:outer membrane protein assembly factor BamB family protein n=1 Tax=Halomontanus rarus TaxID=3034020 RepID=UPI001A97EB1B